MGEEWEWAEMGLSRAGVHVLLLSDLEGSRKGSVSRSEQGWILYRKNIGNIGWQFMCFAYFDRVFPTAAAVFCRRMGGR